MADNNNAPGTNFNEAVCIDVGRVYDSCCDRDCLEDLRCYFSSEGQLEIDRAVSVRLKSAEVLNVFVDVEQVNFNRGYYSCDLTFFFLVNLEVFTAPHACPITVKGIAVFSKKVILFWQRRKRESFQFRNAFRRKRKCFGQSQSCCSGCFTHRSFKPHCGLL